MMSRSLVGWLTQTLRRDAPRLVATTLLAVAALLCPGRVAADPLDETYRDTFYITPIGGWWGGEDSLADYRERMLRYVGGTQPKNLKIGFSLPSTFFMVHTQGGYYDYFPDPYANGNACDPYIAQAVANNLPVGTHVNGTPWGDTADQSADLLCNYLEKLDGGAWLQKDRNGYIRRADLAQNPTINEQGDPFAPYLEMQLSLSRLATPVQQWMARNVRISMRYWRWYQEQHPDLVVFASGSSEYRLNYDANGEYCDYSDASKAEFRDWLSGSGLYAGQGQYASFAAFKADTDIDSAVVAFNDWSEVTPPTIVNWSTTADIGRWWLKFHAFRLNQVQKMAEQQMLWMGEVGLSPDRLYTHQTNEDPASTGYVNRMLAAPYTSAFSRASSNGITTYNYSATNATLFSNIRANDKNWGIFEYNRMVPGDSDPQPTDLIEPTDIAVNLNALNAVFSGGAHVVNPYVWYGQGIYQIKYTAFEEALRQFVSAHNNDRFTGLARYETAPESRNAIWAMSEADDVEGTHDLGALTISTGTLKAQITGADPYLYLELDEATHLIDGAQFHALSLRMNASTAGTAELFWFDETDTAHSLSFATQAGWRVYRINLASLPAWREHRMKALRLDPATAAGGSVELDWVQLHADHAWPFDDANEIYQTTNINNLMVTGGLVSGTDANGDGYFYLATDKSSTSTPADRAFVDADTMNTLRVRITASAAGSAQLYWWKEASGPYSISFPVASGTQTYTVDLSSTPDWNGHLALLRLDPVNTAGVTFSVDFVTLAPRLQPPRIASSDPIHNTPTPVLRWEQASEADGATLGTDLQLDDDFAFGSPAIDLTGLAGERAQPDASTLDGLYWWRIRSRRADGAVSAWTPPFPLYLRRWTFDRLADSIDRNQLTTGTLTAGVWQTQATGGDPFFSFNAGARGFGRGINASEYGRLRLRMRAAGTGGAGGEFYFFPHGSGFVNFPAHIPYDGLWHTRVYDLTAIGGWSGYMDGLRLDPPGGTGTQYEFDSAELLPAADPVVPDWRFDTAEDFENWMPNSQVATIAVSGGRLSYTLAGSDAYLVSPVVNFAAASRPWLRVRLRNQTAGSSAQLYWATAAEPTFSAARVANLAISPLDATVKEYWLDLRQVAGWSGTITRLRFDPVAVASGTVQIDSLALQASPPGNAAQGWEKYGEQ